MTTTTAVPPIKSDNRRFLLGAAFVTLLLDLPAKFWVEATLHHQARIPIVDGLFYLTHARNPGGAFGVFQSAASEWRIGLFVGVSILAVVVVLAFFRRLAPGDARNAQALGLILGGTLGNLFDRLWRGEVIDFLHVRLWSGYVWPDFNVADVAIVVGVATLIVELLVSEVQTRTGAPID